MTNNTNVAMWAIIALIVGALIGTFAFPREVTVEKIVAGPTRDVAGPIQYINNTVEVEVPNGDAWLSNAMADAWDEELSDDDNFLTCDATEYDEDEVNAGRVTEWTYAYIDSNEYEVKYTAKYKFDSSDDDDRCTDTRKVSVYYESNEDPVVNWN